MSSVNKVILIGNMGQDPQIINEKILKISVATTERYKNKEGNYQDKTEWHKVTCFNEHINRYVAQNARKGMRVYVEGKLVTSKYLDEHNNEKLSVEIQVSAFSGEIKVLSNPKETSDQESYTIPENNVRDKTPDYKIGHSGFKSMKDALDDSIPF